MGTYFALMDEAAKRGEDYEVLDQIREVLLRVQKGQAKPEEVSKVIATFVEWESRVSTLLHQADPEKAGRAEEALRRLEALKRALQTAGEFSSNAART